MHSRDIELEQRVLKRVGYFEALESANSSARSCAGKQVVVDLARLETLRREYRSFRSGAQVSTQWAAGLISSIDLRRFRCDSPFLWLHRDANVPVSYLATYYHYLASSEKDLISKCSEDCSFGASGITIEGQLVTRDQLDSVAELGFLRDHFSLTENSMLRVLDIGSGYGRLAWRSHQCFPRVSFLCTDAIPESAYLCEFYLRFRGVGSHTRMVSLPHIKSELASFRPDIAVAVNSLTECPASACEWWFDLLSDIEVSNLLIIPHSGYDQGRSLFTCEAPSERRSSITALLRKRGYRRSLIRPKYLNPLVQSYGVSPTYYHLFTRN